MTDPYIDIVAGTVQAEPNDRICTRNGFSIQFMHSVDGLLVAHEIDKAIASRLARILVLHQLNSLRVLAHLPESIQDKIFRHVGLQLK